MAQITRSTKISGGTTLQSNTLARAVDVETDVLALFTAHNNHDTATSVWTAVSASGSSTVPLTVNNSSGTQNIANFLDNGVAVLGIADGGIFTFAPGGTTKLVVNSSGLTLSNSGTIAMGAAKITGLATGTASTDAVNLAQIKYISTPAQTVNNTNFSTSLATYQTSNLSASITPASASSRVKVTVTGTLTIAAAAGAFAFASIFRASTNLAVGSNAAFLTLASAAAQATRGQFSVTFIDSPATTSSTTYAVKIMNNDAATAVTFGGAADTVIILEEIV